MPLLSRRRTIPWLVSVAALTAPPIAWQNVLSGFHSTQYFLIGLSLGALALLLTASAGTARWWGGLGCAVLALFSMASGLLAAAVVALVLAVSGRPRQVWHRYAVTIGACLAVVAAGWMLQVDIGQNATMRAHSPVDFGLTLWRSLQWPAFAFAPLGLLVWLPWAWLGWRVWRRPDPAKPRLRVVFAAGLWVLLQFAATAYGRGAGGSWPASRYLDTVAMGLLVNALALLAAASSAPEPGGRKWLRAAVIAGWFGVVGFGVGRHVVRVLEVELPPIGAQMRQAEFDTRAYLATGDESLLDPAIPYPDKRTFIKRLDHEEIRGVLPAGVRAPLALIGQAEPAGSFAPGAVAPGTAPLSFPAPWGSYTTSGPGAQGIWRSEPMFAGPRAGYWRIEVTGDLGLRPGLSLQLVPETPEGRVQALAPGQAPRPGQWRTLEVPVPRQAFRLVATDASASGWFGFSAPVEVPLLSHWARCLTALGSSIAVLGGALAILLAVPLGRSPAPEL